MQSKVARAGEFAAMVGVTVVLCVITWDIDAWLFAGLQYARGINWLHLPSGIRLLATLVFAEAGAVGVLLFSMASGLMLFPDDPVRGVVGGLLVTAASYGVYRIARHAYGLQATLGNLTSGRLLGLCVAYALASPLLHHVWFALEGRSDLVRSFIAMFVGDLTGALVVLYAAKLLLFVVLGRRAK